MGKRRGRRTHRGVETAAALVSLLVLLELTARRLERRLPPYVFWHDQLTTGKWHQLRAIRREAPVDVVLAGSSQMLMALDPTVVVPAPARCFNAALYRGIPTVMAEWLTDVVLPATRPRWVFWGISVLDLNDRGWMQLDSYQRFSRSPLRGPGLLRLVRTHSAFARRVGLIRDPVLAMRLLRRGGGPAGSAKPLHELLGPMGKGLEYEHYDSYHLSDAKAAFIREQIVKDFSAGGLQMEALRQGVTAIRSTGVDVALVEMPATQEFHDMYPGGEKTVQEARRLLFRMADELEVPVISPSDYQLQRECFADCVHLNGRGMKALSEQLVQRLALVMGQ